MNETEIRVDEETSQVHRESESNFHIGDELYLCKIRYGEKRFFPEPTHIVRHEEWVIHKKVPESTEWRVTKEAVRVKIEAIYKYQ